MGNSCQMPTHEFISCSTNNNFALSKVTIFHSLPKCRIVLYNTANSLGKPEKEESQDFKVQVVKSTIFRRQSIHNLLINCIITIIHFWGGGEH